MYLFLMHGKIKKNFVDEFVDELKKQGLKVWYDTNKLKWGDSMREKIDKGLANPDMALSCYHPIILQNTNIGRKLN